MAVDNYPSGRWASGVTTGVSTALKALVPDRNNKLASLDITAPKVGGTATGKRVTEEVTFTENGTNKVYTGTITIPAGAWITDIRVRAVALWDDTSGAVMIVGDNTDPNGYYDAVDMRATDLLADEVARFEFTGGNEGVLMVPSTGEVKDYAAAARSIIGVITATDGDGTAGRTRMLVEYIVPGTTTAATATGT